MTRRAPRVTPSADDPLAALTADRVRALRSRLLRWYDRCARDLPWRRRSGDVYAQWVAEVMLQQTRVATATPYYERFLRRFPTVETLAAAHLDEVLALWQGLGYYRRAENLHRAAGLIVARGGRWPATARQWQQLPGVGRYTAGAIASVVLGERIAAVDGNVARVVSRLVRIEPDGDPRRAGTLVQAAAGRLVPPRRSGDFNQACMDLGAVICLPREPACESCPLAGRCEALAGGVVGQIPASRRRPLPRLEQRVVLAALSRKRLLMTRRPRGGRWSGLWELPNADCPSEAHHTVLSSICSEFGLARAEPRFLGNVSHRLTHRVYRFHVYLAGGASRRRGCSLPPAARWFDLSDLDTPPVAAAQRKILRSVLTALPGD